jgi:hypothetical protein
MAPPKRAQNPSTMPPPKRAPARPTPASAAVSSQNPLVVLANHYLATTPQRTKLIDAFMGFLIVTGVLQFMYCIVAGNYVPPPSLSGLAGVADMHHSRSMRSLLGFRRRWDSSCWLVGFPVGGGSAAADKRQRRCGSRVTPRIRRCLLVFLRSGMVLPTDDGELGCGLTGVVGRLRTSSLEALSSTFSALTLSTEFLASDG